MNAIDQIKISRQATINVGTFGHVAHGKLGGFYTSRGLSHPEVFVDEKNGITYRLHRHVFFVEILGQDILMGAMLNGAAVMDAALLLKARNEICPQPITSEHLAAVEVMRLENIIILHNNVSLVKPKAALARHDQIR